MLRKKTDLGLKEATFWHKLLSGWLLSVVCVGLTSCGQDRQQRAQAVEEASLLRSIPIELGVPQRRSRTIAEIIEHGRLVVLTRNAPTTYYLDQNGLPLGPEYELAEAFGEHIGVKPEYLVLDSIGEILTALDEGRGDIVAAGITATPVRRKKLDFGPGYQKVTQQVICAPGRSAPKGIKQLLKRDITIISGSSYEEKLFDLRRAHPELSWTARDDTGTEQLLEEVAEKKLDCTVADSNIVAINRRYHPELKFGFDLTKGEDLAWVLPKERPALKLLIESWLAEFKKRGDMLEVEHRYYGHLRKFDYVEHSTFLARVEKRFPRYQKWFEEAADRHQVVMPTLAAQGYQESHWNPHAVSPTGVRGLMMLTGITAKSLGVRDRTDPRESIFGGAKYLRQMHRRQGEDAAEPDRTWLALAAYNVGLGHLRDAQTLARRAGKNPEKWAVVKKMLPLLSQKRYYRTVKYGYARGKEPVQYVRNIRDYKDVLEKHLDLRG